jgi:hypothetical protein
MEFAPLEWNSLPAYFPHYHYLRLFTTSSQPGM